MEPQGAIRLKAYCNLVRRESGRVKGVWGSAREQGEVRRLCWERLLTGLCPPALPWVWLLFEKYCFGNWPNLSLSSFGETVHHKQNLSGEKVLQALVLQVLECVSQAAAMGSCSAVTESCMSWMGILAIIPYMWESFVLYRTHCILMISSDAPGNPVRKLRLREIKKWWQVTFTRYSWANRFSGSAV